MTTARRRATASALLLLLALVGGCAVFPTSGDVHQGTSEVPEPGQVYLGTPDSPRQGAAPVEIVRGFMDALAQGVSDDFTVAREYLADDVTDWDPWASVAVYSGEPTLASGTAAAAAGAGPDAADPGGDAAAAQPAPTPGTTARVRGDVATLASLGNDGEFTEEPRGTHKELSFTLEVDPAGQWRITRLDDGIEMSGANFSSVYRSVDVYFPTTDAKVLVPDVRWFPQSIARTQAVKAVLAGPAPWLRDAVGNPVPEGTDLSVDSVVVDGDGTATVDLTAAAKAASGPDRAVMVQQLSTVLLQFPGIQSVDVLAAGSVLSVPASAALLVDPDPGPGPYVVVGRGVRSLATGTPTKVPDTVDAGAATATALAVGASAKLVVAREGTGQLWSLSGTRARLLLAAPDLARPSVDRFDRIWTASSDHDAALLALSAAGRSTPVDASWLAGRRVLSVAVSRDGARVVVVSQNASGTRVDLAGVVRNEAGVPLRLTDAVSVGASLASVTQAVWVDDDTLAVLGRGAAASVATVNLVPVGGFTRALSPVNDVVSIAAGHGERAVFAAAKDGTLWERSLTGASWTAAAVEVRLPAFPG
ncbi:LpqB family beta-propeller domain-containing protein [Luteimicrobium subarcticum]|uniref:Sporulation and spore germination protein n=1 Tax=Luteimicrobium subarcticum TaxID=620910 RepID=A0A2M8WWF0_9MICO|nr:LpqB family beta-propeller domain-containing protein [Luteimicrobium subarcticum]PJI95206.1 sporulation and spore germination protein [Luteimicrobium subarcticum]